MSRSAIALTLLAAVALSPALRAAPLDKEGCEKLKAERAWLEQAGTRGHMSKGPHWAKTNLEPGKLDQIRRLLEVDEQLLFRCHGKPLVNLPKDPDPDPAATEPDSPDGAKAPVPAKPGKGPKAQKKEPAKKPVAKKAAAPEQPSKAAEQKKEAPRPEGKAKGGAGKKTAEKTDKKTKGKAKTDGGERGPAGEPNASPFAEQGARQ
jgi:outer membrane biosynthesis protein TonB